MGIRFAVFADGESSYLLTVKRQGFKFLPFYCFMSRKLSEISAAVLVSSAPAVTITT